MLTANVRYHFYRGDYTVNYTSRVTVVVPFYDAEAIYIEGEHTKSTSWDRRDQHLETLFGGQADGFGTTTVIEISGVDTYFDRWGWYRAGPGMESGVNTSILSDVTTTVEEDTTISEISKLVSRAGLTDATMPGLSAFHDNAAEAVEQQLATISGTRESSEAVVVAQGVITEVGTPIAPAVAALVGWV